MSRFLRLLVAITVLMHVPVALGVAELARRAGIPSPALVGWAWAAGGVGLFVGRVRAGMPDRVRWIVKDNYIPDWGREGEVPTAEVPFRTTDAGAQIVAVRQGLGMTELPCFVGDADPLLVRVPGTPLHMHGTLWLLTQGETRKTKRVRLFTEFVSRRLAAYGPLLAGLSPSSD